MALLHTFNRQSVLRVAHKTAAMGSELFQDSRSRENQKSGAQCPMAAPNHGLHQCPHGLCVVPIFLLKHTRIAFSSLSWKSVDKAHWKYSLRMSLSSATDIAPSIFLSLPSAEDKFDARSSMMLPRPKKRESNAFCSSFDRCCSPTPQTIPGIFASQSKCAHV